jgi:hypothetical protein
MDQVLIIPGIGDRVDYLERLTHNWPARHQLMPTVYPFGWGEAAETYAFKQAAILDKVSELSKIGNLAVIGISAGGSKAASLLAERSQQVSCAVNICGRLQVAGWSNHLTKYPVFKRSIEVLEKQKYDAGKVLTLRPIYDQVVPVKTVPVEGASNKQLFTLGHGFSIAWAMLARQKTIVNFIHQKM